MGDIHSPRLINYSKTSALWGLNYLVYVCRYIQVYTKLNLTILAHEYISEIVQNSKQRYIIVELTWFQFQIWSLAAITNLRPRMDRRFYPHAETKKIPHDE